MFVRLREQQPQRKEVKNTMEKYLVEITAIEKNYFEVVAESKEAAENFVWENTNNGEGLLHFCGEENELCRYGISGAKYDVYIKKMDDEEEENYYMNGGSSPYFEGLTD